MSTATATSSAAAFRQPDGAGNRKQTTWLEATPFYVTTTYDALNRPTLIKELGATALATCGYDDGRNARRGVASATGEIAATVPHGPVKPLTSQPRYWERAIDASS